MFMYDGRIKSVKSAVSNANLLLQNHMQFMSRIAEEEYTMTEVDGQDVASFLKDRYLNSIQRVYVKKTWNPWSAAVAWFNPRHSECIYLNSWKVNRSDDSIVGSIIHEYVHLVDNFYKTASFGHGDNYGPSSFQEGSEQYNEKFHSAPYKIGRLAKEYSEKYID